MLSIEESMIDKRPRDQLIWDWGQNFTRQRPRKWSRDLNILA